MTTTNRDYLYWLYDKVCDFDDVTYYDLFKHMLQKDFRIVINMDKNRACDGLDLRNMYEAETGRYCGLPDTKRCSMLEMMVGLSIRCENSIMASPDMDDRTPIWFWTMMRTSGLEELDDNNYSRLDADVIINRINNRIYSPNGEGGLFIVNSHGDISQVEIWYQLGWYLSEEYGDRNCRREN